MNHYYPSQRSGPTGPGGSPPHRRVSVVPLPASLSSSLPPPCPPCCPGPHCGPTEQRGPAGAPVRSWLCRTGPVLLDLPVPWVLPDLRVIRVRMAQPVLPGLRGAAGATGPTGPQGRCWRHRPPLDLRAPLVPLVLPDLRVPLARPGHRTSGRRWRDRSYRASGCCRHYRSYRASGRSGATGPHRASGCCAGATGPPQVLPELPVLPGLRVLRYRASALNYRSYRALRAAGAAGPTGLRVLPGLPVHRPVGTVGYRSYRLRVAGATVLPTSGAVGAILTGPGYCRSHRSHWPQGMPGPAGAILLGPTGPAVTGSKQRNWTCQCYPTGPTWPCWQRGCCCYASCRYRNDGRSWHQCQSKQFRHRPERHPDFTIPQGPTGSTPPVVVCLLFTLSTGASGDPLDLTVMH